MWEREAWKCNGNCPVWINNIIRNTGQVRCFSQYSVKIFSWNIVSRFSWSLSKEVTSTTKPLNSSSIINLNKQTFIGNFLPVNIFGTPVKAHCNQSTRLLFFSRTPMEPTKLISQYIPLSLGINGSILKHLTISHPILI